MVLDIGEKIHEQMISTDDAFNTYEEVDQYIIVPTFTDKYPLDGKKSREGFSYKSIQIPNGWQVMNYLNGLKKIKIDLIQYEPFTC